MKLWPFKSNDKTTENILDQYNNNSDEFIKKYLNDEEWRKNVMQSLNTFVGKGPVWMKDNKSTYVNEGYVSNASVYSIINLISRECKKIKWKLYELDDSDFVRLKSYTPGTKAYRKEVKSMTVVDEEGHDLLQLLNFRANPYTSGAQFQEEVISWKLLTGDSYMYMAGPGSDVSENTAYENVTDEMIEEVQELWTLPAHATEIVAGDSSDPILGYKVTYSPTQYLPTARVMHSKMFNPDFSTNGSNLYGQSPLRAGRKALQQSNDSYTAAVKLLQNLGALGIVYKESGQDFSAGNAQALQRQWESKTGPSQINKLLFAGAKLGWLKIADSAKDLNIYPGLQMSQRELCNLYGVSSILLNDIDNSATFANYEEARKSLITNVVIPQLTDLRDMYNYKLVPIFERKDNKRYYLDLDWESISELKPDLKLMSDIANNSWWLSVNQKLDLMGMPDHEDESVGNMTLVPSNLVPIDESSLFANPTQDQVASTFTDDNVEDE